MRLRVATLLLPGILVSSALASEACWPLTLQEVIKQMDEQSRARPARSLHMLASLPAEEPAL